MIELDFTVDVSAQYKSLVGSAMGKVLAEPAVSNLLNRLEHYDSGTFFHSLNVAKYSLCIGASIGLPEDMLYLLTQSSILHDVGKLEIPLKILTKPTKLSKTEFETIKEHPVIGAKISKDLGLPDTVVIGIHEHHEKFCGGGYPDNLKHEAIHTFGRIIAVADVFDAVLSVRPYHDSCLPTVPIQLLANSNDFDKRFVYAFFNAIDPYPERVRLIENEEE